MPTEKDREARGPGWALAARMMDEIEAKFPPPMMSMVPFAAYQHAASIAMDAIKKARRDERERVAKHFDALAEEASAGIVKARGTFSADSLMRANQSWRRAAEQSRALEDE